MLVGFQNQGFGVIIIVSSHVEAISHPATLRGQRQDVYSKTVKSSCSPATQGSTIIGRCRRLEGKSTFTESRAH